MNLLRRLLCTAVLLTLSGVAAAAPVAPKEGEPRPVSAERAEEEEGLLPRYNPDRHMFLDEAKKEKKDAKVGDELEFPLETREDFSLIAAQTA